MACLRPLLVLILLAGCGGVPASRPPPTGAAFAVADLNADGRLDRDEWNVASAQLFNRLDTDRDGLLSTAEAVHPQNVEALDRNGDAVTDPDEFMQARKKLFAYADGSANGLVSLNEAERVGPAMWEF